MTELPHGWHWATLAEICDKPKYGWTTSAAAEGQVKLLRTTDLTHGPIDWASVPFCRDLPREVSQYEVSPGDIFVSRAGSVGVSVLIEEVPHRSVFASYLIRVRPKEFIDPRFLARFLQSPAYWSQISDMSSGIAIPNINASKLSRLRVPIPSLDEQRRIVALLEDHLSRLDAASSALESLLARTEALYDAVSAKRFEGVVIRQALDEVAEVRLGRQRSPRNHEGPVMKPYLRAANVTWAGLALDDVKEMAFTDREMDVYRLEDGDLLLSEASGSAGEVGKPAIWRGELKDCAFQNTLLRVRTREIDPHFLLHYFRHAARIGTFSKTSRGVGIHHLGRGALAKMMVPVPNPEEQTALAAELDLLYERIQRTGATVRGAQNGSGALRRSLLAAAFSGQLSRESINV